MATLSTLQSDVAGALGLDNTAGGDQPRLTGFANDAVIDMLLRTSCYVAKATMAMTANQGDYTLDTAILAITDMTLTSGGGSFRLRRLTTTDLINLRLFSVTSAPIQMYATNGANMLMLYPTPLQADTLNVYYVPRPTPLSAAGDDPSTASLGGIPTEYHYGLELYMMWKAGDAFDHASSNNGEMYRRLYLGDPGAPPGSEQRFGFIGTMKRDLRQKGGKHMASILIPPRNRRIYIPQPGFDAGSQNA